MNEQSNSQSLHRSDPIEEIDDDSGSGSDCSMEISRNFGEYSRAVPRNSFSRRSRTVSEPASLLEASLLKSRGEESDETSGRSFLSVLEKATCDRKKPVFRHSDIFKSFEELKVHSKTDCSELGNSQHSQSPTSPASYNIMENHPEVEKELRARFFRKRGSSPPLEFGELFSKMKAMPQRPLSKYAESAEPLEESTYRNSLYSFHPEVARAIEKSRQRYTFDCAQSEPPPAVTAFYDEPALPHDCQYAHNGIRGHQRNGSSAGSTPPSSPSRQGPEFRWQQLISPSRRI
jgi:hypothetical protein